MSEDRAVYGKAGQKVNREDVVQAALTVARWCEEHYSTECNCPFAKGVIKYPVPPEVAEDYMAPHCRFPDRPVCRNKTMQLSLDFGGGL